MNATLDSIWTIVSQWPEHDRGALAERLCASITPKPSADDFGLDEATWQEIERRIAGSDDGSLKRIDGPEGLQIVRNKLLARQSA